jgi:hypothetical protein
MRIVVRAIAVLATMGTTGCPGEADRPPRGVTTRDAAPSAGALLEGPGTGHIRSVLELWSRGRQDEAVEEFLRLAETDVPAERFRPVALSAHAFVEEYKRVTARTSPLEAEQWKLRTLEGCTLLLRLSREVARRGREAVDAGDDAKAERLFRALRRVGEANTGGEAEVTETVHIVGQSMLKQADKGFALMGARRAASRPADR